MFFAEGTFKHPVATYFMHHTLHRRRGHLSFALAMPITGWRPMGLRKDSGTTFTLKILQDECRLMHGAWRQPRGPRNVSIATPQPRWHSAPATWCQPGVGNLCSVHRESQQRPRTPHCPAAMRISIMPPTPPHRLSTNTQHAANLAKQYRELSVRAVVRYLDGVPCRGQAVCKAHPQRAALQQGRQGGALLQQQLAGAREVPRTDPWVTCQRAQAQLQPGLWRVARRGCCREVHEAQRMFNNSVQDAFFAS